MGIVYSSKLGMVNQSRMVKLVMVIKNGILGMVVKKMVNWEW